MSIWIAKQLEALERTLSNPSEEPIKLSYPVIQTITQDFAIEIGRGGFGVVYLGTLPGGKIAVKKLANSQDLDDKLFTDEVNCLIKAKHENIVRFLGYCADTQGEMMMFNGRFVLVDVRQRILCFEYISNGNLYDYLKAEPSRDEWPMRFQMIRGICEGLNYLHGEFINHLDLKPENVMLDTQLMPKITDFGLSRSFAEGQSRVFTRNIFGTQGYIAPEAIDNGEISYKSDIFSLGIIIIKLLTGRNKYDLENWQNLLDVEGTEAKVCIKIAETCLDADQHKRPTIGKIIHELNELHTVIRNTRDDGTPLKQKEIDFPSMQDKKQYINSDDSSLHLGIAHLEVIDEEPMIAPPNSDDSALQSGTTHIDGEPASPISGTTSTSTEPAGRVQLVIRSNRSAPLEKNEQTVMLELTGADNTSNRPGLDLVFVVDVSSRMQGQRITELKSAMRFVLQKLGPIDRLCVIACDARGLLCPLREITEMGRQELLELIDDNIEASAERHRMEYGLETAVEVLDNRKVGAGHVGAIIVVSDTEGDLSSYGELQVPVYSFGFGSDIRHIVLSCVTEHSLGGTFSHIQDVDEALGALTVALAQCVAGLLTVSAQDLELTVAPIGDESCILKMTAGSYPQTGNGDGSVAVRFGNLYSREVRKVIVDLRLAACSNVRHNLEFLKVTYSYSHSSRRFTKGSNGLRLPPAPWQLPIIGSLHHLVGQLPHGALRDLARRHGPVMLLRFGEVPTLVVSDADAAEEVMKTQDVLFASRPLTATMRVVTRDGRDMIFAPYGDYWRQLRKIAVTELFTARRVMSFHDIRKEEVAAMLRQVESATIAGNPVDMRARLTAVISDSTFRAVMGDRCKQRDLFLQEIDTLVAITTGLNPVDLWPSSWLAKRFSGSLRIAKANNAVVFGIIRGIIQQHLERPKGEGEAEDLLDVLLKIHKADGIDMVAVEGLIFDMFTAGSETAATTLEWALSELIRNPTVMKKATAEVRRAFEAGGEVVEEKIKAELPYLQLVIRETFRLHPPLALLRPRVAREPCKVLGFDIPKGTQVLVNIWALGRDEQHWPDAPEEFRPERFETGATVDLKGTDFELLPFGAGRRMCPAMSFGLAAVELPLASLLLHFDWEAPDISNPTEFDMTEVFGVNVRRKANLVLRPSLRVPVLQTDV